MAEKALVLYLAGQSMVSHVVHIYWGLEMPRMDFETCFRCWKKD